MIPDHGPYSAVLCPEGVDSLAAVRVTTLPAYPATLASAHIAGRVRIQFIVTARGRVDTATFKVLRSTHELFAQSVRAAFVRWTARSALLRGKAVAQWMQVEVEFDSTCVQRSRRAGPIMSGGKVEVCDRRSDEP